VFPQLYVACTGGRFVICGFFTIPFCHPYPDNPSCPVGLHPSFLALHVHRGKFLLVRVLWQTFYLAPRPTCLWFHGAGAPFTKVTFPIGKNRSIRTVIFRLPEISLTLWTSPLFRGPATIPLLVYTFLQHVCLCPFASLPRWHSFGDPTFHYIFNTGPSSVRSISLLPRPTAVLTTPGIDCFGILVAPKVDPTSPIFFSPHGDLSLALFSRMRVAPLLFPHCRHPWTRCFPPFLPDLILFAWLRCNMGRRSELPWVRVPETWLPHVLFIYFPLPPCQYLNSPCYMCTLVLPSLQTCCPRLSVRVEDNFLRKTVSDYSASLFSLTVEVPPSRC